MRAMYRTASTTIMMMTRKPWPETKAPIVRSAAMACTMKMARTPYSQNCLRLILPLNPR